MNEFQDIDRELADAFAQRPSTLSRPSLRDVRNRARRRQRQRSAGVLGACAVVGVGGAAVLATRSPANQTTVGDSESTATTICFPTVSTIVFDTTTGFDGYPVTDSTVQYFNVNPVKYVIQPGDNPQGVAAMFSVTMEELNAANVDTQGYELFLVGLEIWVPASTLTTATTTPLHLEVGGTYTLAAGDFPGSVAAKFNVTVAQLDAVNRDVNGYGGFIVGTVINIPIAPTEATTTTNVMTTAVPQTTLFPEPTAWTTTTTFDPNPVEYTECFPVVDSTMPEPTVSTLLGDAVMDTTTSSIPSFTKVGTAVQVINCSNQEGVALFLSNVLAEEGFTTVEPDTGTIDLLGTKIIYNPDDPAALQVALTLAIYLGNATVEPSGPVVPGLGGTWIPGSGVIVLLGDDFAGLTLAQIAGVINGLNAGPTIPASTTIA
ncbi:MAG: LytR C-terminal domain-containing protein [Ilumatobacteraceae bacterium]